MQDNRLQPEEQKLDLTNSDMSVDFRKVCKICYTPFSRKSPRLALKCFPSQHQLCGKCVDEIIEHATENETLPKCPFDRKPFTEDDIIIDLAGIDVEEDIRRRTSLQLRENRSFREIANSINNIGESQLSRNFKESLIRKAGFKTLVTKFKKAQRDLMEFTEMRTKYVGLLKSKALKLRIEQIVKALSIPLDIAGIVLAPTTGGSTLVISGTAAGIRFVTTLLLQKVFSDNKKIVECINKCSELANRPAVQDFLHAFQNTQEYLNGEECRDLLTNIGLQTISYLLGQVHTIAASALQFLGSPIVGKLFMLLGIALAGAGCVVAGYSIYQLQIERENILEMIKDAEKEQEKLECCMKRVKLDSRFMANLENEVGMQAVDNENDAAYPELESISLAESTTIILPNSFDTDQL